MVTTEKDAINLPEMAAEFPIFYLRVGMEIEGEEMVG